MQLPLHPALVHFPIGLFVLSLLFDVASFLSPGQNPLVRAAFYAMTGGLIMAVLAAIPGLADWSDIRRDHPGRRTANYHIVLNLLAIVLYAGNLLTRLGDLDEAQTPIMALALSIIGVGTIVFSGYLGGRLVYDEGIGVGRHRRYTPTPADTIRVSSASTGSADGFVRVAGTGSVGEGETLRVEADGTAMTIVKLDGAFYAFQEFCTHRFGPLSEGSFHDLQVECPWHRSCFDVRTGKVTQGPAKVDLRTFEVRARDGNIEVRVPRKR